MQHNRTQHRTRNLVLAEARDAGGNEIPLRVFDIATVSALAGPHRPYGSWQFSDGSVVLWSMRVGHRVAN